MKRDPFKWKHQRGDRYYFYEGRGGGWGHVIRRLDGRYDASSAESSSRFKKLSEAKRFVERAVKKARRR